MAAVGVESMTWELHSKLLIQSNVLLFRLFCYNLASIAFVWKFFCLYWFHLLFFIFLGSRKDWNEGSVTIGWHAISSEGLTDVWYNIILQHKQILIRGVESIEACSVLLQMNYTHALFANENTFLIMIKEGIH